MIDHIIIVQYWRHTEDKRHEITEDTPEFLIDLMKKCWDFEPKNRPTAKEIRECIDKYRTPLGYEIIKLAESKRKEIIKSQKYLTNEKSHKNHPESFYTSRALSKLIQQAKQDDTSINNLSIQKYLG